MAKSVYNSQISLCKNPSHRLSQDQAHQWQAQNTPPRLSKIKKKLEGKVESIIDAPFMIQSHLENIWVKIGRIGCAI